MDGGAAPIEDDDSDEDMAPVDEDDDFEVSRVDKAKIEKSKAKEEIKKQLKPQKTVVQDEEDDDGMFAMEDVGEGDEFMAVKPWIGQMKEPTGFTKPPKNANARPDVDLDLEWVHGYRSHDCKNNVTYLKDGSIAYHAAGLGICYDDGDKEQRFFKSHIDDVTAFAYSSDGQTIATGEVGPKPSIYIWDGLSMQVKH